MKIRINCIVGVLLASMSVFSQVWTSHKAYNNVTQIALSPDFVYAISDGSLYSVHKLQEYIHIFTGLSGTDINCIDYDNKGKQLVIGYANGKIDFIDETGIHYLGALYDKDMTQRKTIHSITIDNRTAYLSTPYGVQTLNLDDRELVDSYWLRPGGQETEVLDVLLTKDSIYAFTSDSLFCASRKDNIVDYTYWKREKRGSRISPDPDKGKHYEDGTSNWYAGGQEGIVRVTQTERNSYKPAGPLVNNPYRMTSAHGKLWVVPGGRWASEYNTPGIVMCYDGHKWTNIDNKSITDKTGNKATDFMNVAIDPKDEKHYFVTSYGTGLYEFRSDTLYHRYIAYDNNSIVAIIPSAPQNYTRLDNALYDNDNNLWFLDAANISQLQCLDASGEWHAITLQSEGGPLELLTPSGLIIDNQNSNYKWLGTARYNTFLYLFDDNGTHWDTSDDRYMLRKEWTNQDDKRFIPSQMRAMMQDHSGRLWIGTELGAAYIKSTNDFFNSDEIIQLDIEDQIYSLCEDSDGNIWIGTYTQGVYVLDDSAKGYIAHFSSENSIMPSNTVLSLTSHRDGSVFIGTSNGLVQYNAHAVPESTDRTIDKDGKRLGDIMQWKMHSSYQEPKEIIPTPSRIYVLTAGAMYYLDRAQEQICYLSKESGLNGTTIEHAAYDPNSKRMVIAYDDGRIDLLDENGVVYQMPDLYLKAGSIAVSSNCIEVGSEKTYLGMSFGILALNTQKGEISDTYYIGDNATEVNVLQIVELGDSIFAFTNGSLYSANIKDNLADFVFWNKSTIPSGDITNATAYNGKLHILIDGILYCRENGTWQSKSTTVFNWIHVTDNKLLTYIYGQGLFLINDDYTITGITNNYIANDAIYSQSNYWLISDNIGLVKLSSTGDEIFLPNGPNSNFGYSLTSAHGNVYSAIGGRWSDGYLRLAKINLYDGSQWKRYNYDYFFSRLSRWSYDPVSIAVDPKDAGHFFVATYGTGVVEFKNYEAYKQYDTDNSTLKAVIDDLESTKMFTRTDGAMYDDKGNFWVLNATYSGHPVHILTPNNQWYSLPLRIGGEVLTLITPTGIWIDRRDSQRKWLLDQRYSPGVIMFDDGGTPTVSSDDKCVKRSEFIDQNNNTIRPSYFYCWAQDLTDRIWIGTENGIITIPSTVDFFSSNECKRIIIPRNDGTGLGDYLLGNEIISCMAVDGGNRMWIGTNGSGLYVIEDDTITAAHFTEDNSLLPSNTIQSITIVPQTGEVFVGTDKGIASYLSDSSEPKESMSDAYAYPNPVRPDYGGAISITNLMDNSEVNIIDANGNLVCKTRSHGGTAVWDGKLKDGRRATAGVYTALCNSEGGHTAVKIMVIR